MAHLSAPDMRTPIAHALGWPRRIPSPSRRLDLAKLGSLVFQPPAHDRFPALNLAIDRKKLSDTLFRGFAKPIAQGAAPPGGDPGGGGPAWRAGSKRTFMRSGRASRRSASEKTPRRVPAARRTRRSCSGVAPSVGTRTGVTGAKYAGKSMTRFHWEPATSSVFTERATARSTGSTTTSAESELRKATNPLPANLSPPADANATSTGSLAAGGLSAP